MLPKSSGSSLLLLILLVGTTWASPHVFKRDSDYNVTDNSREKNTENVAQELLTTPLSDIKEENRSWTASTSATENELLSSTTSALQLQLPSYSEDVLNNKTSIVRVKTTKNKGYHPNVKPFTSKHSDEVTVNPNIKFSETQGSVNNSLLQEMGGSTILTSFPTAGSLPEALDTTYSKNKTPMQLMQADERFTTSAMPQKVTFPSPLPKQVRKTDPIKLNSTQKIKVTTGNSVLPKPLTTPKSKAGIKPNDKKRYGPTSTVQSTKKPATTPSSAVVTETLNSIDYRAQKLNCEGLSPPFDSLRINGTFHVRSYPASAWLSTSVITNNRILAELEARNKLQRYFDGDNEKGIHLNRTCPVLTQIKFKGPFSEPRDRVEEYAISFYLPWNGQSNIASPNDSEVLVDIVEERVIYVREFTARVWEMTDSFLQNEARKLSAELRKVGEAFLSKYFYVASYAKSPTSEESSKYEIWLYATRFRPHDVINVRQQVVDQPLSEITRQTRSRVCKGFECPSFEVLAVHKMGIQKRRYYSARFATYLPEFCSFTKASIWRAFMPLHLYKHGVNSHFEVIGATRPAGIVHVKETSGSTNTTVGQCNQTFTVSLYLPKRLHAAPPVAGSTAPRIKITELDDVIVFVQSIGGFLLVPDRIRKEVELFRLRLIEQNLCYRKNEYYLVVYDYITRFHGRLNEIWAVADRCSDSM